MQAGVLRWDDLRVVLAVARGGNLAAGAKALGVDATTVSRKLRSVERALGAPMFERAEGHLAPSRAGRLVLARAGRSRRNSCGWLRRSAGPSQAATGWCG